MQYLIGFSNVHTRSTVRCYKETHMLGLIEAVTER